MMLCRTAGREPTPPPQPWRWSQQSRKLALPAWQEQSQGPEPRRLTRLRIGWLKKSASDPL